jgi:hypothetical protein
LYTVFSLPRLTVTTQLPTPATPLTGVADADVAVKLHVG